MSFIIVVAGLSARSACFPEGGPMSSTIVNSNSQRETERENEREMVNNLQFTAAEG